MDIRPSPIAGQWYPADPSQLTQSVEAYMDSAAAELAPPSGEIVGVIAPHAGHMYSGAVAGFAFLPVRGKAFDVVAVLAPSHRHTEGPLLTTGHEAYGTPLGMIPIDQSALAALRTALAEVTGRPLDRTVIPIQCDREHAIEIELPFLQCALEGNFNLLPLMVRDQNEREMVALGTALAKALAGRRALLVGSSDLSHYYRQSRAQRMDAEIIREIDAFNPEGVLGAAADMRGEACGHGAIAATLWAARERGANRAHTVRHATSGDINKDYDRVVGYAAAWIWKE